jgi:hypothetical protein
MGYHVFTSDSKFFIKEKNIKPALKAVRKELDSSYRSLFEAMVEQRWEIDPDDEDNIDHICFTGENLWDADKILKIIAPYVDSGSFIEMTGEDGDKWRYCFNNGEMKEIQAKITWEE